ncbi:hypothetical protein L6164_025236 [Bauhinia variegata]|uniref:Uncharacterized protein n=1 Tax=Bauhinia variegata TaxID=167791 RepID=A0ACB9M0B0_BAUVA|nr:hypothetical protein L6164_025236 [Bauhinia variegata]
MEEIIVGVATKILEKLATKACQEAALAWGLKDEVERLQNSMQFINAFLVDAENKKAGSHSIGVWLRQLKAAFHDAEDVLDEMECEALRNEVVKMHGSATRKVRRFFSSSNPLLFRIKMAHKIKHVKERIDEIASDWKKYGLIEHHPNNLTCITQGMPLRETHSHLDESLVIGRDNEKEELISFMMSQQTYHDKIPVISIVGIEGLGKTTLAKLMYNDERIIKHFESRVWVCVSNEFDVKKLISKILKEMGRQNLGALSFNQLQSLLREEFLKKKCLLILDDVWNEDRKKWVELSNNLLGAGMGQNNSKIIVTTRSEKVSSVMGTTHQHKLKDLSKDESWKLFVKWAFQEGEEEQQPRLKQIGKEIVKKCKGVPLAVVSLASMLYSERDVRCDNLVNLPYDLAQLPALKKLTIGDCDMLVNFQEEEKENIAGVQDLSLEHFIVFNCPSLKSLPCWLQRSKTLQYMLVASCESLEALPEWMPNLKSLEELEITGCLQLSERCRQDSGLDWPKAAHIPK